MASSAKKRLTNEDIYQEKFFLIHKSISDKFQNDEDNKDFPLNYSEILFSFCKEKWGTKIDFQVSTKRIERLEKIISNIDELYNFLKIFINALKSSTSTNLQIKLMPHFLYILVVYLGDNYKYSMFMKIFNDDEKEKECKNLKNIDFNESKSCISEIFCKGEYFYKGSKIYGEIMDNYTQANSFSNNCHFRICEKFNEKLFLYLSEINCSSNKKFKEKYLKYFFVETIVLLHLTLDDDETLTLCKQEIFSKFIANLLIYIFDTMKQEEVMYCIFE